MERTLKDIALELLAMYQQSETAAIYKYSGHIHDDILALNKEVDRYTAEIERLSNEQCWG